MEGYTKNITTIGFDADDTLWVNETFFREAEEKFANLLSQFETKNKVIQEIVKAQIKNIPLYGYGIKGFTLSMMECALDISNNQLPASIQREIIFTGKNMLEKPVELLPNIQDNLDFFSKNFRILLLTKGDLLDQERKLEKSRLTKYFHHVEILSEKKPENYSKLLSHLNIKPSEFLMIGNSLKSDVLPLLEIGARAVHIPFHTTWEYEKVTSISNQNYITVDSISELIKAYFS